MRRAPARTSLILVIAGAIVALGTGLVGQSDSPDPYAKDPRMSAMGAAAVDARARAEAEDTNV
jgi:hypothetical protein